MCHFSARLSFSLIILSAGVVAELVAIKSSRSSYSISGSLTCQKDCSPHQISLARMPGQIQGAQRIRGTFPSLGRSMSVITLLDCRSVMPQVTVDSLAAKLMLGNGNAYVANWLATCARGSSSMNIHRPAMLLFWQYLYVQGTASRSPSTFRICAPDPPPPPPPCRLSVTLCGLLVPQQSAHANAGNARDL